MIRIRTGFYNNRQEELTHLEHDKDPFSILYSQISPAFRF
jgi:hypothetical protein